MRLWQASDPLVLASKSRSRQLMLAGVGISFEAVAADLDERAIEAEAGAVTPGEAAALLALAKARRVAAVRPKRWVLGGDQTLSLGPRRFSKPRDRDEAAAQLRALSGRTHELHSACALLKDGEPVLQHVSVAHMTMRALSEAFITAYLDSAGKAVTSSVGAYQLEALGAHLFTHVEGDHFTILGLPLLPLMNGLRAHGLLIE